MKNQGTSKDKFKLFHLDNLYLSTQAADTINSYDEDHLLSEFHDK